MGKLMLTHTMVPMDMVTIFPTTVMDMVMDMPTMDTMDTHMLTMDITTARDLLMLMPVLMLTTDTTHMPMDTMDTDTTLMDTMDTMDTPMLMVTTDIINLFIFVKELRSLLREMGCS